MTTRFYFHAISIGLSKAIKKCVRHGADLTHNFLNINLVWILLFARCFKLHFWEHIHPFVIRFALKVLKLSE